MRESFSKVLVGGMLGIMSLAVLFSSWNDAAIFDETAHIGAGYSYLTQKDMRLNPEHPPLVKDIAALPLLLLGPNFRTDTHGWQDTNGQWEQGAAFLYEFGNDPDSILHLSRFPTLLWALLVGVLIFWWVRSLYGNAVALFALFFWTFSPTALAHSRYVTTDTAATFGFLLGIATFVRFLERPTKKRLAIAGLAFGLAQTLKFSLVLLIPIDIVLAFVWILTKEDRRFFKDAISAYIKVGIIFAIGLACIWLVYAWHVWNYPPEKQLADTLVLTQGFHPHFFVSLDLWLTRHSITRPLGEYLLGVIMVTQRTAGGNSAYFLGQVSSQGWHYYFPVVYLLKETLAFHILSLLALVSAMRRVFRSKEKSWQAAREWIHDNFAYVASAFFAAFYWASSVSNPLNIGVRHVLPTFPFIYILVSRQLVLWISDSRIGDTRSVGDWFRVLYATIIKPIPKIFFMALMLTWIILDMIIAFPYYLSYYNELVGTKNGYRVATDSNYDWGQDLKRLRDRRDETYREAIYLDYFGGGSPQYYLGSWYKPWYSSFGPPPYGSLFAISANALMGNQARPIGDFKIKPEDTYPWLRGLSPFARAGSSIFLYRIP